MKIAFFSAHAAIWVHALPENRIVRELTNAGHDVSYLTCGKAFSGHCASMSAYSYEISTPEIEKDVVCRICQGNADTLAAGNRANHGTLRSYLRAEDEAVVDAFVADVSAADYLEARWDGMPIGRIAAYEMFLKYKKMSPELRGEEWEYYKVYLKNTLRAGLGFKRYLAEQGPEVMFCYSPQYAVNGICAELASREGTAVYFLEGSSSNAERYQALRVWDWSVHGLMNPALRHWDTAKVHVQPEDSARIKAHFDELFSGTSFAVYSAPHKEKFSVREHFKVPAGAKLLLATLSSYDEAYAAVMIGKFPENKMVSNVFRDQFEWIHKTIDQIAGREDIFLLVRVHPRDFPNKREKVQSEQAIHWQELFRDAPPNVAVNWPHEEISLYNILAEVDVVLTGWSATGVEALAFGIPVVTYDRTLPSYPADIHLTGETEGAYFANIEEAIRVGRRPEHATAAIQWLAVSFSLGTVRVCEPTTLDRAYAKLVGASWLSARFKDKLAVLWRKFEARRAMSSRKDADLLRRLVARKATDIIDVAVEARPALSLASVRDGISRHWNATKISQ